MCGGLVVVVVFCAVVKIVFLKMENARVPARVLFYFHSMNDLMYDAPGSSSPWTR